MLERIRAVLDQNPRVSSAPGDSLAAVLTPLLPGPEPALVFTRRASDLARHPGEISFPGGLPHDGDPDLAFTALRETEEELGIRPAMVELLGALPAVHTVVSGVLIVPFVGLLREAPEYSPSPVEIAEVLEYTLADLAEAEAEVEWRKGGRTWTEYAYDTGGVVIWGATGRILHSLLEVSKIDD